MTLDNKSDKFWLKKNWKEAGGAGLGGLTCKSIFLSFLSILSKLNEELENSRHPGFHVLQILLQK